MNIYQNYNLLTSTKFEVLKYWTRNIKIENKILNSSKENILNFKLYINTNLKLNNNTKKFLTCRYYTFKTDL